MSSAEADEKSDQLVAHAHTHNTYTSFTQSGSEDGGLFGDSDEEEEEEEEESESGSDTETERGKKKGGTSQSSGEEEEVVSDLRQFRSTE